LLINLQLGASFKNERKLRAVFKLYFSMNVDEQDLIKIKSIIAKYFAEKAISSADKDWKEKGYTQADADKWLTGIKQ